MTDLSTTTTPEEKKSSFDLRRIVLIASAALIGVMVLLLVLALVLALVTNGAFADIVRTIRDIVIIFMALEGALIIISLAVLVLQIARLINLLQTEVKPILDNAQETVKTAQGTVGFVSDNLVEPVIKVNGFLAGASVLLGNLFGIRRAIRRGQPDIEA